jgi:histidyl-tRNA synthetase
VLADAPAMRDHLCEACAAHYAEVKTALQRLEVPYREDARLVRGLDYYTRTAFEYIASDLEAAQNAVGGGGRYDGLAEVLGGRPTPAVGFALGIDRIVLSSRRNPGTEVDVYVVSETTAVDGLVAASVLRGHGLRVDFDTEGRSVKSQFKSVSRLGARVVAVVKGPDSVEVRVGEVREVMPLPDVGPWLEERLR